MKRQSNISVPLVAKLDSKQQSTNSMRLLVSGAMAASIIIVFVMMASNSHDSKTVRDNYGSYGNSSADNQQRHNFVANIVQQPKIIQSTTLRALKIDKMNKFIQRFAVNGREVMYTGPSSKWSQLLAYKPIPKNQTYTIKYAVSFSANNHIMLGITSQDRITQVSSFFNQNTYAYYGHNGCLWAEGKLLHKDEIGYKEKDLVEINVQLWEGLIEWKVNGKLIAQVYSQNLKQNDKQFVPYFQIFETGDTLRMLSENQ